MEKKIEKMMKRKKIFLYISEKYCTFADYFAILARKHIITHG